MDALGREKVARAKGLAEALARPISPDVRPGSTEEIAAEIVALLDSVLEPAYDTPESVEEKMAQLAQVRDSLARFSE